MYNKISSIFSSSTFISPFWPEHQTSSKVQTEGPVVFSPCMYVKGNTIRPCPTVMEMWLICWHSTWSHGALRTFSSPSTTRAAAPSSSKLPGTTQLLCCSSLTLPTLPPTAGYHISILLFRGDRGTSSPSQEPKAAELQNPLILLALDPLCKGPGL